MRGIFHLSVAAAAIALAATGSAQAQSTTVPASFSGEQTSPAPDAAATPTAPTPQAGPLTGPELMQTPLASGLTEKDTAVAEQLRALVAGKLSRSIERRQDRAGVEAFYRDRGFAPLWTADGAAAPRAKDVAAFLRNVAADGLDPADYPLPEFQNPDPAQLAQDELKLTNSLLTFTRHARTGRVSFSRVSGAIYYDLKYPEAAEVLGQMAGASDVRGTLDSYHPQHRAYKALKAKLAEARKQQKPAVNADTLIANMERWRWMPRELGKSHVVVNIPDFTLQVRDQGKTAWSTRIVVGKVGEQATPLLSETMKFITVNPTWNVPPSIIRNEYLPALQRDPSALSRIGLKVAHNKDGTLRVYQPPGERNALGRIRFNFPNKFLVYQHDTPQKHLFAKQQRAYSHGCMRVQHPEQYAEVLLSISQPGDRYSTERIRRMFGDSERTINLATPIPVHLTYQTAFVDDAGLLQTRPDVYGHDRTIIGLMRKGDADTPIARNYNSSSKPVMARGPNRYDAYAQERRQSSNTTVPRQSNYIAPSQPERVVRQFDLGWGQVAPRRGFGIPY